MEGFSCSRASLIALMAVLFAVFSLIGDVYAAEAPAPSPTSGAAGVSPSVTAAFIVSFAAFLFGSFFH